MLKSPVAVFDEYFDFGGTRYLYGSTGTARPYYIGYIYHSHHRASISVSHSLLCALPLRPHSTNTAISHMHHRHRGTLSGVFFHLLHGISEGAGQVSRSTSRSETSSPPDFPILL